MKFNFTTFAGFLGRTLITLGVLILFFAAFQLWGTGITEKRAQDSLEAEFEQQLIDFENLQEEDSGEPEDPFEEPELVELSPDQLPDPGQPIGIIEIESIGLKKTIIEGVTRDALRSGPGRYPSTSYPGQPGNSAIAGHRTTYGAPFFNMDKIKPGELIKVTTLQGVFFYEVEAQNQSGEELGYFIVSPNQTEVLANKDYDTLTLTGCHPKYSAAQRIIVTAKLTTAPAPKSDPKPVSADVNNDDSQIATAEEEFTESLGWQSEETQPTVLWALLTTLLAILVWIVANNWKRWPVYLAGAPVVLTSLYFCFLHLEKLIPAV